MASEDEILRLQRRKEEAFKAAGRMTGDKGRPYETVYALSYDKLALAGLCQRLRSKYRAR